MRYSVEYTTQAVNALKKLDSQTRRLILAWIEKNLVGCENPRIHGKGLTSNHSGEWRYRRRLPHNSGYFRRGSHYPCIEDRA